MFSTPRSRSFSTTYEPRKPAPPVTTTRSYGNLFDIVFTGRRLSDDGDVVFFKSARSASTIILANSLKVIFGSQPSFRLAFEESPMSRSTSAGRK